MGKKERVKVDFRLNPDNIKVNDWVFSNGNVGLVQGVAIDTENMLQFFVLWNNEPPVVPVLAENLKKLNRPVEVGGINYTIDLDLLVLSPELQQRVKLDKSVVEEYAEAFKNHVKFPPITIWYRTDVEYTGTPLLHPAYLIDGFHRVEAAKIAGITELPFIRKQGTFREALLYSTSINSTHGLRRSKEDKRKSVMTLLQDPEWSTWSNVAIANQCGVSESFVRKIKKESNFAQNEVTTYTNKYGVKTQMNTTNIGKKEINEAQNEVEESESHFAQNEVKKSESHFAQNEVEKSESHFAQNEVEKSESHFAQNEVKKPDSHLSEDNPVEDNPVEDIKEKDDDFFPEDVIKNLWDEDDENVNEDSVSEDSVSNNEDHEDNLELQDNELDNEDNLELQDNGDKPEIPNPTSSKSTKRTKKKQRHCERSVATRLVNTLSVGDKVTVKGNHYFAGREGEITQISSPNSVLVAFEDNQRQLLYLKDLDLPESLQKPLLEKPSRPQKKEIVIKEGLNYFAGSLGSNCKWYLEVQKHIYEGLKIYQSQINAIDIERILTDLLIEKRILKPHPDDCTRYLEYDEKPSPINSLNSETRNKLENIVEKHGVDAIFNKFED